MATKYFIITVSILAISLQSLAQKKIGQRRDVWQAGAWKGVDSIIWDYNSNGDSVLKQSTVFNNSTWAPLQRNTFIYNTNGKVSKHLRDNWVGGTWVNGSQFLSAYNLQNNIVNYTQQTWNAGTNSYENKNQANTTYTSTGKINDVVYSVYYQNAWAPQSKEVYGYDVLDSLAEYYNLNYNAISQAFENNIKRTFYWSAAGPITQYNEYLYNKDSGQYFQSFQILHFYTSNGDILQTEYKKNNNLAKDKRISYTYGTNNKVIEVETELADTLGAYNKDTKTTYSYNAANLVSESAMFTALNNVVWLQDTNTKYTYDGSNRVTQIEHQQVSSGVATTVQQTTNIYYPYYTHYLLQDVFTGNLVNKEQAFYYYNQYPLNIVQPQNRQLALYPNPCSNNLNISNELLNNNIACFVKIYTMQGALVLSSSLVPQQQIVNIPVADLAEGNYVVELSQGNNKFMARFNKN
jgi:hypothetical protein